MHCNNEAAIYSIYSQEIWIFQTCKQKKLLKECLLCNAEIAKSIPKSTWVAKKPPGLLKIPRVLAEVAKNWPLDKVGT